MSTTNFFKTSTGDTVLPTTDGEYFTDILDTETDDGEVYFEFYNSEANARSRTSPVTPTAGTIVCNGSPLGNLFLRDVNSVTVNATEVSTPDATYTPPFFSGRVERAKIELDGVTGATHLIAVLTRRSS